MIKNLLKEFEDNIEINEKFLKKVEKETIIKGETIKFVNNILLFSLGFFNLVFKSIEPVSKIKERR